MSLASRSLGYDGDIPAECYCLDCGGEPDSRLEFCSQCGSRLPTHDAFSTQLIQDTLRLGKRIDSKKERVLVVKHKTQELFFSGHTDVLRVLICDANNPLVTTIVDDDDQVGEYFITKEMLKILIKSLPNAKNIYVINIEKLYTSLKNLNLTSWEEAKFIIMFETHGTCLYLRKEKDTVKCFFIDCLLINGVSEYQDIINAHLSESFSSPKIFHASTEFQYCRDWSSCTTFCLVIMEYLNKHGDEVFPFIENIKDLWHFYLLKPEYFVLPKNIIMPELRKWSHFPIYGSALSNPQVTDIDGNVTSLREFIKKYTVCVATDVSVNAAIFLYKYIKFSLADKIIREKNLSLVISDPEKDKPLILSINYDDAVICKQKIPFNFCEQCGGNAFMMDCLACGSEGPFSEIQRAINSGINEKVITSIKKYIPLTDKTQSKFFYTILNSGMGYFLFSNRKTKLLPHPTNSVPNEVSCHPY